MTAHLERQKGVTLIELVLSMLIISIAFVGILSVMNLTVAHSADPIVQYQAVAIAESYLEEILLQSYQGGATAARADFDDVDDYNGLSDSGAHDQNDNAITGLSQYNIDVVVSAPTALAGGVDAKQITVSVAGPGISAIVLTGYKTDY